jgi:drug/metabolite transporter (DMT)-like permease
MPFDSRHFFSNRKVVYLLATLCVLLWGSSYPAIKNGFALFGIVPTDIPSKMVFAGYRFFFAGIALLAVAALTKRDVFRMTSSDFCGVAAIGVTQTFIHYIFFYIGLANTTGVKSSIMNATGAFFSVILAHFIYANDRLSVGKSLGCLMGFLGVLVVNFNSGLLDFDFSLLGEGFVVIAAFILSATSIYGKKLSQKMDSIVLTGYQLAIGGALLYGVGVVGGGTHSDLTLTSAALLAYLVFLSAVSISVWTILLKYNPVGMVTVFNFLVPIFGALLSAIFLGETVLEWKNVVALTLVCIGIRLVTRSSRNAAAPVKEPSERAKARGSVASVRVADAKGCC